MDQIWWKQVTNATLFIEEIVSNVENEKNVVLHLPTNAPWYHTLKSILETELESRISKYRLKSLCDREDEPGEIVMREFCKKEKRDDYRPGIGYAKYLADCDDIVLNERIVWINNISSKRYGLWSEFICQYAKALGKKRQGGIFILEIKCSEKPPIKKGISLLSYDTRIGTFDVFVFYLLTASMTNESIYMKQYLAELVTAVIGTDIELGSYCVNNNYYKGFLNEPFNQLCDIVKKERRSNGEEFKMIISAQDIEKSIWNAQIKVIFPLIEDYREYFIEKYSEQITPLLPHKLSCGEEYIVPNDVEIGPLCYWVKNEMVIISEDEKRRLNLFRDTRNDLAHLRILNIDRMKMCFSHALELKGT